MIIKLINYIYDYPIANRQSPIANRQSPIANRQSPINIILNFLKYFSKNKNLFIYAYTLNYIYCHYFYKVKYLLSYLFLFRGINYAL